MQTFLPWPSFAESAAALDWARCNKQITETFQIARALTDPDYGWQHHTAVRMWRGHTGALALYGVTVAMEWQHRGYDEHGCTAPLQRFLTDHRDSLDPPSWLGDEGFHRSHRSNLLRKAHSMTDEQVIRLGFGRDYYDQQFAGTPDDLPYVWPIPA